MQKPSPSLGNHPIVSVPSASRRPPSNEQELAILVDRARVGDPDAWTRLVERFDGMLRHIARSYRLTPADVDDVVQTTWLHLFEAIGRIREPMAIAGWLATAARRSALRRKQTYVREHLTADPELGDRPDDNQPETGLLAQERRAVLAGAVARLPSRHRGVVNVLLEHPTLAYREVSELLGMPIGSIGPIRARSLMRLGRDPQLRALSDSSPTPVPAREPVVRRPDLSLVSALCDLSSDRAEADPCA
jgi:RNA polymerase sigma factor (sigma-70 family)